MELLNLVLDQTPTASMLVLLTCRPHFQPAWHHRSYLTEITVNRLSHAQVEQIVAGITDGKTFPAEVLQQILAKTDGVPLFVEEMTKAILVSGQLTAADGHYDLTGSFSTFAIPATLQDSLMARLDRLVTTKAVAQYAAVIGRQFSYTWLQACSQIDAATLQRELGRLVEAEIVYQRGMPPQAIYVFKHALIRDSAYKSLLKSTRQQYHQRIAQVLEAQFPETVEVEPELLVHHLTEAGLTERSVIYWYRAGQRANERSAHVEAIAHLHQGLELLKTLPETSECTQREVDTLIASAQTHFARGLALYDAQQQRTSVALYGEDTGVICHIHAAWALWYLGYPEQGLARSHETLRLAQQSAHPYSPAYVLGYTAQLHQFRREGRFAQEYAEAVIRLATDQGFPHQKAIGMLHRGWALVHQGQGRDGVKQLTQGLSAFRALGAELAVPYYLALLAEAWGTTGEPKAGLAGLTEALTLVDTTGERWYESEIYRLKGELLLQRSSDRQAEGETCFHHALDIARNQQARSPALTITVRFLLITFNIY